MKRRFALPVSIALALHAGLFLGSSAPRIDPPPPPKTLPAPEDEPMPPEEKVRVVELKAETDPIEAGDTADEPEGDDTLLKPPPGLPDIDLPSGVEIEGARIVQTRVVFTPGDGTKPGSWNPGRPGGKGDGNRPFGVSDLDKAPRTRFQKAPAYPRSMQIAGIKGTVWVDFMVDERGRVSGVRVLKSTHPDFDAATIAAVSEWRFEPGTRKSLPVRFRMSIPIVFSLND